MRLRLVAVGLALLGLGILVGSGAVAGGKDKDKKVEFKPAKPGEEQKVLAQLVGTWDAKVKFTDPGTGSAGESTGSMKRAMIMGGRFLKEDFTGSFMGEKFQGMGIVGFDADKKKYVTNWIDNFSTNMTQMEGTYDAAKKTLTNLGDEIHDGKKMKTRHVLTIVNDDEQRFEMYHAMDGKEFKAMEITYVRAKEKKKEVKKEKTAKEK